jgi:hypothetical protein
LSWIAYSLTNAAFIDIIHASAHLFELGQCFLLKQMGSSARCG